MKKIFLFLLFAGLAVTGLRAQSGFEGRIEFTIEVKGAEAEQMKAYMPTAYEYLISGTNMRMITIGGMAAAMMGDMVIQGEEGKVYMVKDDQKRAFIMPDTEDEEEEEDINIQVEKMNETLEIAGYTCQKYKVMVPAGKGSEDATQYMWTTTKLDVLQPSSVKAAEYNLFVKGLDGFPLKVVTTTNGMTLDMTVREIEKKSIPASKFEIPSDYEVTEFNPASLMGR
ncbi:MAG: DUF4412 domain-containing protein [Bacteroidota bacterium]